MKLIDKVKILKKMAQDTCKCAKGVKENDEILYHRMMSEFIAYDSVITMLIDDDYAKKLAEIYHVEIDG